MAEFGSKAGLARYIEFCQDSLFTEAYPGVIELEPISRYFRVAKDSYPDPSSDERDPFRYVEELGIKEAAEPMQETIYNLPIATYHIRKSLGPVKSIRKVLARLSNDELYATKMIPVLIKRSRIPSFYNSVIEICASFVNTPCEKLHIAVSIIEECLKTMMDIHPEWESLSSSTPSSSSLVPETPPPRKKVKKEKVKKGDDEDYEEKKEEEEEEDNDYDDIDIRKMKCRDVKTNFTRNEFPWLFYNSRLASKFCDLYCAYCLNKV